MYVEVLRHSVEHVEINTNDDAVLAKLGRRLNVRQIALATAEIYLSRFLIKVLLKEINVYLLVTTCLYAACKIEECPQHIRLIISEARNLWPEYIPQDMTKLAEFEFYLIEEMDLFLLLHHPYKSLLQVRDYLIENQSIYGFILTDEELQNSWSLINDSYVTDLHLLFPPHIVAMATIYITIVLKKNLSSLRVGNNSMVSDPATDNIAKQDSQRKQNPSSINTEDLISLTNGTSHDTNDMTYSSSNNALEANGFQDMKIDENTIKINKFMNFLDHSHINLNEVVEAIQDIINLYVVWNRYNENSVKKALQNMLLNRWT